MIFVLSMQQVKKSDPLTKICMECKATLLDVFIFVRKVKTNDQKWRKVWLKSTKDVFELSSDEELPSSQIKQEPVNDTGDINDDGTSIFNPSQYIKEEGETSDSDFEEKELIIECDVGPMVTSTTRDNRSSGSVSTNDTILTIPVVKQEPKESPKKKKKKKGPTLRERRLTTAMREWSTSESSTDDSDVEAIPVKKPLIDLTKVAPPKPVKPPSEPKLATMPTPPPIPTTTTSTLACTEEIAKKGFNSLAEKMLAIKWAPNLTDDEMCKIFYGLKCPSCPDKEFNTLDNLESHFKDEHDIRKISVKCCDVDIIKPIMVDHIKYHLGVQKTSLKDHIRRLQTMQICEECGLLFPSEKSLKVHIARAHTELHTTLRTRSLSLDVASAQIFNMTSGELKSSRHICDICEKPFYYESTMKHHKRKHLSLEEQLQYKRFECHDCATKFYERSQIQKHIEVVHAKYRRMASGRVTCLECNNVLSSMAHLSAHKAKHWTQEERQRNMRHVCDICQKTFWYESALKKHRMTHSNPASARNYTGRNGERKTNDCPHCEKRFAHRQNLDKHLRTHMTADERYQLKKHECATCTKRFFDEQALKDHIKFNHLKIYDYICDVCKRPYSSKKALKYHSCGSSKKIYVKGGKPEEKHECEFCGKVFGSPSFLRTHMYQWHLPGFIYECPTCQKGFNHNKAYHKHKKMCAEKAKTDA